MKQTNFLKSFFLLFALIVGSSSVWADNKTLIFTPSSKSAGTLSGAPTGVTATFSNSYNNANQITGGNKMTLTLSGWDSSVSITGVTLHLKTNASSGSGSATAKIGSTTIGTMNINTIGSTYTDKVMTVTSAKATSDLIIEVAASANSVYCDKFTVTYNDAPDYAITPTTNDEDMGTVELVGSTITATPKSGYRVSTTTPYEVTNGTAEVSQNGNVFTVTPTSVCTVQINFEAIPTYAVTFNAEGGLCDTPSATEKIGGGGVTLPTATTGVAGWEFAGWAADAVDNTTTQPTLYKAGSTYYPTIDTELHAVYTLSETSSTFVRVTSINQVEFAKSIVVVKNSDNFILNHNKSTSVTAPTETNSEISAPANAIFTLSGDNSDGFVLTGGNGTLSQTTLSTSNSNGRALDWTGNNNQWIIEAHNTANTFTLSNSENVALEYYSGWKTYYTASYSTNNNTPMKLYVPKSVYDSTPSALIIPTVAFDSADPVTLYLDGTTENTNTATVTGVSKTINYTSSNTGVATVNSEGVVTAVGIGTTTITASVDAELGVSVSNSDTYEVTVKSATTISGLKTIDSTSGKAFTADLTNAVVTYVKGSYAYIQDASAAILVNKSDHGLIAGQKINGAVSGTVKITNSIDQLTAIDLSAATVTEDGVIPAALTKTVAEVSTNAAALDGQLVTINAVTIDKPSTTTTLRDGSKIGEEEATITMFSPNGGASVTNKEKGNFTGYISLYNGETPRINLYEQSQFKKTHNAPHNQVMSFANNSYNLDEETDAVTSFAGQEVTKTTVKGAVTYSIKDGSNDIITSLNSSTGAVVLNGDCGTATIVATAAAYDEYDEGTGYYTPYKELTKEYSVTVRPRYSVTFSVNGIETVLRQSTFGATIAVPTPGDLGDYTFMGWSTSTVDPTDDAPSMTDLGATVIPTDNDDKYYAVYAKQTIVPDVEQTSTFTFKKSSGSSPTVNNEGTWTFASVTFVNSNNCGLNNQSITVTPSANVTSIKEVTVRKTANTWGKNVTLTMTDASSNQIFQVKTGDFTSNLYTSDLTDHQSSSYTFASSGMAYVENIVLTYLAPALAYADYRTSLTNVEVTISESKFLSFCYGSKLDFSETDVKAYKASVDGEGKVTLTKVDVVPAGEGVVLYCETPGTYSISVTTKDASDVTGNQMVGVLVRTQVEWNPEANVYNYILQQGEFRKATTPGGYLKPNRAYLSTSYDVTIPGAKALSVVFAEDETDGIRSIENSRIENSDYYNLAGQKVGADYKGIVIVNGKKYMRK